MADYDIFDSEAGKPRMCAQMCDTCILRPGSVVTASLRPGRLKELLEDACRSESYVVCHSTFDSGPAVCRGFADHYSTNSLRILGRIGGFHEINPPSKGAQ